MILIIKIDIQVNIIIINKFYLRGNNIMRYITLLIIGLVILLCLSGFREHYVNNNLLIDNKNYNCPFPCSKYHTFMINNEFKIRKSYLLLDAPPECCNENTKWGKVESDCSEKDKENGLCGKCTLDDQKVDLKGTSFYPYQKFNTYCRPFIKYNWEMKTRKI